MTVMAKRPFSLILLMACSALLLASGLTFLILLFGQGQSLKDEALSDGRYARINLEDGTVEGNVRMPEPPAEVPPAQIPPESVPPVAASTSEVAPAEPPIVGKDITVQDIAAPAGEVSAASTAQAAPAPAVAPVSTPSSAAPVAPVRAPLNAAPNTALSETVGPLVLPKVAADGMTPSAYYKKPFTREKDVPLVAVVIRDLGLHAAHTKSALMLDEYVTLSFSPYAQKLNAQSAAARAAGHELWLQVPMEPEGYPANDAGPYSLLRNESAEANLARLHEVMATATGYVGLVAPPAELFSAGNLMGDLAEDIRTRGLLLLQHKTVTTLPRYDEVILSVSRTVQPTTTPEQLRLLLSELETVARTRGYAVLSLPASPGLLAELPVWLNTLKEKKLSLAPLSAISLAKNND